MLVDQLWEVSKDQDLHTPSAGNIASTNSVSLSTPRDLGLGTPLRWDVHITEAFAEGVASTLTIAVVTVNGASAGNLLDASQRVLFRTAAFTTAELALNRHIDIPIPPMTEITATGLPAANLALYGHVVPAGSFMGLVYVTTGNFTAGAVTSVIHAGGTAEVQPAYHGFNGYE